MVARIFYEQPLHERVRTFLRLEHLFSQAAHHLQGTSVWDSRAVVSCLLDIINLFGRSDLKSEVIKELERHSVTLSRMANSPGVDTTRLNAILADLDRLHDTFLAHKGQVAAELKVHELLASIMQRSSIPGGTCVFDLPEYHYWLSRPDQQRQDDLEKWLDTFALYQQAVSLILHLVRNSSTATNEFAPAGFYQHSLDSSLPVQLIRVALAPSSRYFPQISGGKHRFSVRFMVIDQNGHQIKIEEDVHFELTCCTF